MGLKKPGSGSEANLMLWSIRLGILLILLLFLGF